MLLMSPSMVYAISSPALASEISTYVVSMLHVAVSMWLTFSVVK